MTARDLASELDSLDEAPAPAAQEPAVTPAPQPDPLHEGHAVEALQQINAQQTGYQKSMALASKASESLGHVLRWEQEARYRQDLINDPETPERYAGSKLEDLSHAKSQLTKARDAHGVNKAAEDAHWQTRWNEFEKGAAGYGVSMIRSHAKALEQYAESAGSAGASEFAKGMVEASEYLQSQVPGTKVESFRSIKNAGDFGNWAAASAGGGAGALAQGLVMGPAVFLADSVVAGHGAMRDELQKAGITDPRDIAKASYLYGSLVGALQAVVPVAALKAWTTEAQHAFAGTAGQVAAKMVAGTAAMTGANSLAGGIADVAQQYGVTDLTGEPIDWGRALDATAHGAVGGLMFGLHHEAGKGYRGGYKIDRTPPKTPEEAQQREHQVLATERSPEADARKAAIEKDLGIEKPIEEPAQEANPKEAPQEAAKPAEEAPQDPAKFDPFATLDSEPQPKPKPEVKAEAVKPAEPAAPIEKPLTPQEIGKLSALEDVLSTAIPRKEWGRALEMPGQDLEQVVSHAVKTGLLRVDPEGIVRRAVNDAMDQLEISGDVRAERAIAALEAREGRVIDQAVTDYIHRIEADRGGPDALAALQAMSADRSFGRRSVHDVASVLGIAVAPRTSKGAIIKALQQRHALDAKAALADRHVPHEQLRAAVEQAVIDMSPILPPDAKVKPFESASELPEGAARDVARAEQAGYAVDAMYHPGTGEVYLSSFAVNPAGRLGHEGVHALRARGLITDAELSLLADHAAKVPDLFDRAAYEKTYAGRTNSEALLQEESAAHLIEARINGHDFGQQVNGILDRIAQFFERLRNALSGHGFQSVDDVVNAFLSGEMAQREVAPGVTTKSWGTSEPPVSGFPVLRGQTMFAIRAYHGSPHDFDRFSMDKITKEDRQSVIDGMTPGGKGPMFALSPKPDLDPLGYYSKALEAARSLKQAKGTPEQMLAQLKSAGVKEAEIQATGLDKLLSDPSVKGLPITRAEIVKHLEENRVGVKEMQRIAEVESRLSDVETDGDGIAEGDPRWSSYSLDPSNPTYRETVLHLPEQQAAAEARMEAARARMDVPAYEAAIRERDALIGRGGGDDFRSGHFPEPNIIGHMMTSETKHPTTGGKVFTVDQIQSDWGQKLRDGGVRDEAKIAELRAAIEKAAREAEATRTAIERSVGEDMSGFVSIHALKYTPSHGGSVGHKPVPSSDLLTLFQIMNRVNQNGRDFTSEAYSIARDLYPRWTEAEKRLQEIENTKPRLEAELRTAEATAPGHPLVNTTDQWTNTTLRRAIRQAAETDAQYIAIPSGDTVLSYNPGDTEGMRGFYDKIVPKNLRNLLQKIDKESPSPERLDKLITPSKGPAGEGFTVFPLTEKVKASVLNDGQPMFALRPKRPEPTPLDRKAAEAVEKVRDLFGMPSPMLGPSNSALPRPDLRQHIITVANEGWRTFVQTGDSSPPWIKAHSEAIKRQTRQEARNLILQRENLKSAKDRLAKLDEAGFVSATEDDQRERQSLRREVKRIEGEIGSREDRVTRYNSTAKAIAEDPLPGLLAKNPDALKAYAPDGVNPGIDGFMNFFRDFVAWPTDAKRNAPEFYSDFADVLDAHNPQLLAQIQALQEHSRMVNKVGSNTPPDAPILGQIPQAMDDGGDMGGGSLPPRPQSPSGGTPRRFIPNRLAALADRLRLGDVAHDLQMKATPMAAMSATVESRGIAKDFANSLRRSQWEWLQIDEQLQKRFSVGQLEKMWIAADEQSVAIQTGKRSDAMNRLTPQERATVEQLQTWASQTWEQARALGMVEGEGLPSYVPRMIIRATGGEGEGGRSLNSIGRNLKTKTGQMMKRKHLTAAETEDAARAKLGDQAELARNIRALPLAISKMQEAIAGRSLVEKIKQAGRDTTEPTVVEGAQPANSEHGWFTIDHPAFKILRPKMADNPITGKRETVHAETGEPVMEKVPLYVRDDFEGPLKAVLTKDSGTLYNALMDIKGRTMSVIMFSPIIHNMVEFGRAFPAMPGKMITGLVYFQGNKAKRDAPTMREAIDAGLAPIGHRAFNQDITSMVEQMHMEPGRSITSKLLAAGPGLISDRAGTAVKRGVDAAGDFWHNTLLWDRVADLQMGLYVNFRDKYIEKGFDRTTSARVAAHFANRYAGALPMESMSTTSRKLANVLMFSRSFTIGNLGAMKDVITGLPRDVQAQILRDAGPEALKGITSSAKKKALTMLAVDLALLYAANSTLQNFADTLRGEKSWGEVGNDYIERFQALMHRLYEHPLEVLNPFKSLESLSATSANEPGKQDRVLIGYQTDGTAIYARNPVGKIGEEFLGYLTSPFDMVRKKMSTLARPAFQTLSNDKGFGRKVYNPYAETPEEWAKNVGRIVWNVMEGQTPSDSIRAARDLARGVGDPTMNKLKILGPLAGVTFSKGAPGGPAAGEIIRANAIYQFNLSENLPEIRKKIQEGDIDGARKHMTDLGVPSSLQSYYVRTTNDPSSSIRGRKVRNFLQRATPEERDRFHNAIRSNSQRQQQAMPEQ